MATSNTTLMFNFYMKDGSQGIMHIAFKRYPLEGFPPIGMEWEVADQVMTVERIRQTKTPDGTLIKLKNDSFGPSGIRLSEAQVQMLRDEHWQIDLPKSPNPPAEPQPPFVESEQQPK